MADEKEKTEYAPPAPAPDTIDPLAIDPLAEEPESTAATPPAEDEKPTKGKKAGRGKKPPKGEKASEKTGSDKKPGLFGLGAKYKKRRTKKNQILRIEDLEDALASGDSELDPETIVSMYLPRRRARRLGAALLRTSKLQLALLLMVLGVCFLFILSFMQEKMGNFTINLNRLELYRRGISIAADGDFTDPTARLNANTVSDATNISIDDLPEDINEINGDHNGKNYMAYTYFVRNAGKEEVAYIASITLDKAAKGADKAVRVAVWFNDKRVVYAMPAKDGGTEAGCENFISDTVVCQYTRENFSVGDVDKYTIAIWMEGDDPECVDSIVGGSVQFSMNIDAEYTDNTNLVMKFFRDIVDSLTGQNPINAAGTDAPDFDSENITYANRRNQGENDDTSSAETNQSLLNSSAEDLAQYTQEGTSVAR